MENYKLRSQHTSFARLLLVSYAQNRSSANWNASCTGFKNVHYSRLSTTRWSLQLTDVQRGALLVFMHFWELLVQFLISYFFPGELLRTLLVWRFSLQEPSWQVWNKSAPWTVQKTLDTVSTKNVDSFAFRINTISAEQSWYFNIGYFASVLAFNFDCYSELFPGICHVHS